MAKVGKFRFVGELRRVRQPRQRGYAIHRRTKNQLGPLRRPRVFECFSFEFGRDDEISGFFNYSKWRARRLERAHPGWSVEFILHMRVCVARSAHEGGAANDVAARKGRDDFFAADSVLGGEDSSFIEAAAHQAK